MRSLRNKRVRHTRRGFFSSRRPRHGDKRATDCQPRKFALETLEDRRLLATYAGSVSTIVDNGLTEFALSVAVSMIVGDIDIELDVAHTRDSDLDVYLKRTDGTRVQLFTDVGGNGEAVGESGSALIVQPGDAAAFADAVLRLLEDPGQARSMGKAAAERAARFSVAEQVRQTEELYLELAKKKGLIH